MPRSTDLILLGVVIRLLAALFGMGTLPSGDERKYLQLARWLAEGKGYIHGPDAVPTAHHPPLFPTLLALCGATGPDSTIAAHVVQAVVGLLVPLTIGWLLRCLYPSRPRLALVGLLLALWYPPFILASGRLLSEPLFILLLLLALGAVHQAAETERPWLAAAGGLCCGLASLTRGNGLILLPAWAALWLWRGPTRKQAWLFLVSGMLVLLPWTVRNYYSFGAFIPGTTSVGAVLWQGMNPPPEGYGFSNWGGIIEVLRRRGALTDSTGKAVDEWTKSRVLTDEAVRSAFENPWRALRLSVRKVAWLLSPYDGTTYWPRFSYNPATGLLYALAAVGAWGLWRERRTMWPVATVLVATLFLAVLFYGSPRFRHPADATLILWAAFGIDWSFGLPVRIRSRLWYCAVGVNLLLFALDSRPKEWMLG